MVTDYPGFYVLYGDGMVALIVEMVEWIDPEDNKAYKKVKLKPTDDMLRVHEITEKDMDPSDRTVPKQYPAEYCVQLNYIPNSISWLFLCNYEGREANIFQRIDNELLLRNKALEKQIEIHKKHIAYLQEQLLTSSAFPAELEEANLNKYRRIKTVVGDNVVAEMKPDNTGAGM